MLLLNFRKGQEAKVLTPRQRATNDWFVACKEGEMKGVLTKGATFMIGEYKSSLAKKLGLTRKTWENKMNKPHYIVRYADILSLKEPVSLEKPVRGARRATPEEEKKGRMQYCLSFIEDDDFEYFEGFEKSFQKQMSLVDKYHQTMVEWDCIDEFYDYITKKIEVI